jgi:membrane protein
LRAGTAIASSFAETKATRQECMMMNVKCLAPVLKQTLVDWNADRVPTLGAALAYYMVFSLAPVLLIAIGMASLVVGADTARAGVVDEIKLTLGPDTAGALTAILDDTSKSGNGAGVTLLGLATLLIGASGVFVELQDSLNRIWKTEARPQTGNIVVYFLRNRLLSFSAVVATGFLLLASLVISSYLSALSRWLTSAELPGTALMWHGLSLLLSFGLITVMFALIFKVLPDALVTWRDVWIGAALTALLFTCGQSVIGLYLGQSGLSSAYGAVGSLVVLLVWVYYSAQIVLFGAEFTHAYAHQCGSRKPPQSLGQEQRPYTASVA